ncbi:MAG: hypothetical protein KAW12_15775 [Candidatus Aminicenantes bacterium]|nr:hypothetical protein [Candidatus Aminicenantes bacterium]
MKKLFLTFVLSMFVLTLAFSQGTAVPEKVSISLDALLKTRTSNGGFNMKNIGSYFFAAQGAVYVNVLFAAELEETYGQLKAKKDADHEKKMAEYNAFVENEEKKLEERNKKIREKNKSLQESKRRPEETWEKPEAPLPYAKAYHNLYLRVVRKGKVVQQYKSPMPTADKKAGYYSFGLILEPGKYELLLNVNCHDDSQDGTLLVELDAPKMTVMEIITPARKISFSTPTFYKKINTLHQVEERFTVVKDCYRVSPYKQEFYPYLDKENKFKASDTPTLSFFIMGVNQPWNVNVKLEVKQGKKKIVAYKVPPMTNPFFFQPIEFKGEDKKPLPAGDYVFHVSLVDDEIRIRKGKIEVPFKIVE